MGKVVITLKRGLAGKNKKQKRIIKCLGLRKVGDKRIFEMNDAIKGMVEKVKHLIEVTQE